MTPEEYCQDKAARSGSSFYYSFRFLPKQQREAITALYAFCREIDDIVDDDRADTNIAKTKLDWWRDEIARLFHGQPTHPVALALKSAMTQYTLAQEYFTEIIDGMEMDLNNATYPSFKELALYCYRVASAVGLLSIEIFGYHDRRTQKYAHELGMAFQLTNILRDVYEDAQRGRIYIPQDEMARFGVSNDDILNGVKSDHVTKLLQFQAQRAREYYQRAFQMLPEIDRYNQRSGLIMAEIYKTLLDEIEIDGYRVFDHRIKLTPIRKLWIAWSTARREKGLHRKLTRNQAA